MDPAILAKSGTEHAHQRAYFQWLLTWERSVHAHTFAIPNGGARAENRQLAAKRGGELKAEGVKSGVPDIMVAWPLSGVNTPTGWTAGLFIEMKKVKGGKVSDNQSDWRVRLEQRGYTVATCFNWQEAANATAYYFGSIQPYPHAARGA